MQEMMFSSKIPEYEWGFLYYFEYDCFIGFSALKKLVNSPLSLSKYLDEKLNEKLGSDSFYNSLSLEEQSHYYSKFYESENLIIMHVEQWNYYSICLSSFSFLEAQLQKLCIEIQKLGFSKQSLKKLKGGSESDLDRFNRFLSKVFEADTSSLNSEFELLKGQKNIRNFIAHHGGNVPGNKNVLSKYGLSMDEFRSLKITQEYLEFIISTSEKYVAAMIQIIDERYKAVI